MSMYLGRIVAVAVTPAGTPAALYRVSSRSFPNRLARTSADGARVAIVPAPGHETDINKNPYIAYNCARLVKGKAVLTNGSHTDPIAEKIAMGLPPRDALALSLLALDYEKDEYNTPRIAAVADAGAGALWLATVRADGLAVKSFKLAPGKVAHLSTYEHNSPRDIYISDFAATTAEAACDFILAGGVFADFTNAVTAVAAVANASAGGFTLAHKSLSE